MQTRLALFLSLLLLPLFIAGEARAENKIEFLYVSEPELVESLHKAPANGAILLNAVIEKGAALFPSSILNPESHHGNPVVCFKVDNSANFLKQIKATRIAFLKDPGGKICQQK